MSTTPTKTRPEFPVIFLFGPTGVGKTDLLLHLDARLFSVINADSKQVYRHLDIGSAKPDTETLKRIEHLLIDIRDPWEQFSVGDFVNLADEACSRLIEQNRIPILCGGTAYYFKHFLFGLPCSPPSDPSIRKDVAALVDTHGLSWCYEMLRTVDPISAERIHPSDGYRITRALEVYRMTGKPLSDFHVPDTVRSHLKPLVIGLNRPKEELDERIDRRVEVMFNCGLEQEIAHLKEMGAQRNWPGIQGIGYREFFDPNLGKEQIPDEIRKNSRAYAKRQMTFFKSLPGVHWIHPDDIKTLETLIGNFLSECGYRICDGMFCRTNVET